MIVKLYKFKLNTQAKADGNSNIEIELKGTNLEVLNKITDLIRDMPELHGSSLDTDITELKGE